ncbi:sulfatase [Lutibacter sp. HS1-25]|uniref:sulfatase n=1 Tax=Lutibacter sp. HS1-25 TaxID=2485000 RepID=UPI001013876F|nr:sulfatase [Lutibacter sp. HS1-25]RXP59381.1 sulfatase [Lutibacter sp. HS1-25]
MRKLSYIFLLILISSTYGIKAQTNVVKQNSNKPNVLFIAVDDLNTWLGCLNNYSNTKTPNIDKLAASGVLFSNAHCQAPLCGPSRASLMTGLRPSSTGIYGMIPDEKIRSENPATKEITFLPEYFKNNGYYTMGIGKLFHDHAPDGVFDESGGRVKGFGPLPEKRFVWDGFGTSDRKQYGRTSTDWGAFPEREDQMPDHQSVDWTIERLNKDYDKPFFMGLGFLRPHVPLYVPQKWFDMHPIESIQVAPYLSDDLKDVPQVGLDINDLPMMPSTEWAIESGEWKKIIQAYLACVSYVDYEIGRVMEALENSKYAKNTVIVLWSDHGYRLGEKGTFAKHGLWDSATKAPLLFVAPNLPKGKIIDAPVEMLSVYPTLLELCGLSSYERNEGVSLVQSMLANKPNKKAYALTTYGMNNHSVSAGIYRFTQYEDGSQELYNHKIDPNEFTNLAKFPEYKSEIEKLKKYFPKTNKIWDANSSYTFQPYFVAQKARTNGADSKPLKVIGADK